MSNSQFSAAQSNAVAFAARGYKVLPLHGIVERDNKCLCACGDTHCGSAGKHPQAKLAPDGLKDATTDANKIKSWGPLTNYGVVTDPFVVIDADARNGG